MFCTITLTVVRWRQTLTRPENARQLSAAFTLTELLAVIAVIAILALAVLPALARSQPNSKAAFCQNNLKQLAAAWQMYTEDYSGTIALNHHGGALQGGVGSANWVRGWLDWGPTPDNTNVLLLIDSQYALLAPYVRGASNLFKCPADNYLTAVQQARGWAQRVRSYSANIYIGDGNAASGPTYPIYKQIKKLSEFRYPAPSEVWLYLDEHPDSINDSAFFSPYQTQWIDMPAAFHQGGAGTVMTDGHAEVRRWRGSLATGRATRVTYDYSFLVVAPPGDPDIHWMSYHTPRSSTLSY